jgi:hypothetical protein
MNVRSMVARGNADGRIPLPSGSRTLVPVRGFDRSGLEGDGDGIGWD